MNAFYVREALVAVAVLSAFAAAVLFVLRGCT